MKLYLECNMGAAGDMIMGALVELLPDRALFLQRMQNLGLPGVQITCDYMTKCGITGTKIHIKINDVEETSVDTDLTGVPQQQHVHEHDHVPEHHHDHPSHYEHKLEQHHTHPHEHPHDQSEKANDPVDHRHHHYSYQEICTLINNLALAENVKQNALAVYKIIGEAEAFVHGVDLDQIHFHEVGALDAVVDVVGCCLLFQMLGIKIVEASPIHVGSGFVRCAHGVLPVPAPATAHILKDIPIYGGKIKGELCTPTGAALLRHFVRRFGEMEPMAVTKIGYGMGTKDFEAANCIRAFLSDNAGSSNVVAEISCNLDDMTPEAVGLTIELLMENGALDVFATPVTMKKSRPAVMLTCLCKPDDFQYMIQLILQHTTTHGVRYQSMRRSVMDTAFYNVVTAYGEIRIKTAKGFGITKEKPEYEDVRKAALDHGVSFSQVYTAAVAAMSTCCDKQ